MATSNDLNISQSGYVTFDGTATFRGRTFQASSGITLTNPNGVSGNTNISTNVVSFTSGLIDWTVAQNIPIFTTDRVFIVYFATYYNITVNNLTLAPNVNLGWTPPNYDDFSTNAGPGGTTSGTFESVGFSIGTFVVLPAGKNIFLKITTPATATVYQGKAMIMGVYV